MIKSAHLANPLNSITIPRWNEPFLLSEPPKLYPVAKDIPHGNSTVIVPKRSPLAELSLIAHGPFVFILSAGITAF